MTLLDTPAVVVDLDRLERNLARWQAHCDRIGLANRPHVKTHRSVEIAQRQLALGAAGVTCQKLGEAEVMADAGITDILVPYNVVGAEKLERLGALAARATVTVSVDDEALLAGLAASVRGTRELGVLVDCDTGLARTGVATPEHAALLAGAVARREGLRFAGFLTYPSPDGALPFLRAAVALAASAGLAVDVVSAGGTPTMWSSDALRPTVTEYRVGTYAFHDRATVAAGAAALADVALTVHATVVSRPAADRAILDAGSKTLSSDPAPLRASEPSSRRRTRPSSVSARSTLSSRSTGRTPSSSVSASGSSPTTPASSSTSQTSSSAVGSGREPRSLRVDARGRSR